MLSHGTVFEVGSEDPNITCDVLEFSEGQYIRGLQFYSSASTITQMSVVKYTPGGVPVMPAFGKNKGSNKSPFFNYHTNDEDVNWFYGFESQSVEEDFMTLVSLAFVSVDIECSNGHKAAEAQRLADKAEERLRLEEEERQEEARLAAEEAKRAEEERLRLEAAAAEDEGGSGGAVAAVVIVLLLLLVGGAVWLHFSDKACCCLKDKVRACKTRSSSFIKRKCCKNRQQ